MMKKSKKYLSVQEFAGEVQRFPNQIYNLITKGNSIRKLEALKIKDKWMIPESEVHEFPFNSVVVALKEQEILSSKVAELTQRVTELENKE